jgi:hypothetical protein
VESRLKRRPAYCWLVLLLSRGSLTLPFCYLVLAEDLLLLRLELRLLMLEFELLLLERLLFERLLLELLLLDLLLLDLLLLDLELLLLLLTEGESGLKSSTFRFAGWAKRFERPGLI